MSNIENDHEEEDFNDTVHHEPHMLIIKESESNRDLLHKANTLIDLLSPEQINTILAVSKCINLVELKKKPADERCAMLNLHRDWIEKAVTTPELLQDDHQSMILQHPLTMNSVIEESILQNENDEDNSEKYVRSKFINDLGEEGDSQED